MPIANSYNATWFLTLILRSLNYGSIRRECYLWSANISVQSIRATGNKWCCNMSGEGRLMQRGCDVIRRGYCDGYPCYKQWKLPKKTGEEGMLSSRSSAALFSPTCL